MWDEYGPLMFTNYAAKSGDCDPAHTTNNGRSSKGGDDTCAPLNRIHHDEFDGRRKLPNGEVGRKAFAKYYGIDMRDVARKWYALYLKEGCNVRNRAEN